MSHPDIGIPLVSEASEQPPGLRLEGTGKGNLRVAAALLLRSMVNTGSAYICCQSPNVCGQPQCLAVAVV